MLTALDQFPFAETDVRLKGGRILLATDASAGDAALGPTVAAEAIQKGVSIDAILTGDCVAETAGMFPAFASAGTLAVTGVLSDVALAAPLVANDPLTSPSARTQLRALTGQTGGVLFQVTRAEVGRVVPTLLELSDPANATLATRRLTLTAGVPATVEVPVDETLSQRVTFMVALSRAGVLPTVSVTRPDGSVVAATDPGVARLLLTSVDSYTISFPTPGVWRLTISGQGSVIARVFGSSGLDINLLRFIDPTPGVGRPEVEFVPIEGQPIVATSVTGEIRLTGNPTVREVRLRREDGTLLQTLSPQTRDNRYARVAFVIPAEPFVLEAAGVTPGGNTFVRQIAVPVSPQTVAISASPKTVEAMPGSTATFRVTIRNASTTDATYALRANTAPGWSVTVPAAFAVPAGGSTVVDVGVLVPMGVVDGTQGDVTLLVQDVGVPTTRNSTRVSITVVSNRAPNCAAATAEPAMAWPPNHKLVAVNIAGVTDPDGDHIMLTTTGITQDEPVVSRGHGQTAPDATGVGSATPAVRAERNGKGDGRVYAISFSAADGRGGVCQGTVTVGVPKTPGGVAIDSGQAFDSTVVPPGFKPDDDHDDPADARDDRHCEPTCP